MEVTWYHSAATEITIAMLFIAITSLGGLLLSVQNSGRVIKVLHVIGKQRVIYAYEV